MAKASLHILLKAILLIHSLSEMIRKSKSIGLFEQFQKKYEYEDLIVLAFVLPKNIPLTINGILSVYPTMSKRHIYEIIAIKKDLYEKIKKNLTKIS